MTEEGNPDAGGDAPPLDPDAARRLAAEVPPGALARLADTFEADLRDLLARLSAAARGGDAAARARAAHALAGAAANLGAMRLAGLARAAGVGGEGADPAAPGTALARAADDALAALRRLAGPAGPGGGD